MTHTLAQHAMSFNVLLMLMIWGHALADYPLQGDFLANAKRGAFAPEIPWWMGMLAHAWIHAGFVFVITHSFMCALGELLLHFAIDRAKCTGKTGFIVDQVLHVVCKFIWAAICVAYPGGWL